MRLAEGACSGYFPGKGGGGLERCCAPCLHSGQGGVGLRRVEGTNGGWCLCLVAESSFNTLCPNCPSLRCQHPACAITPAQQPTASQQQGEKILQQQLLSASGGWREQQQQQQGKQEQKLQPQSWASRQSSSSPSSSCLTPFGQSSEAGAKGQGGTGTRTAGTAAAAEPAQTGRSGEAASRHTGPRTVR